MNGKIGFAIAAALAMPAGTVNAQAAAPDALEEIVVTATRRDESAQDIPLNITAIDEGRLREGNVFDLTRLPQEVPGLTVIDYGTGFAKNVVLRGMNATRLQLGVSAGTTGIYMNDTVIDSTSLDIVDVARVEVLRGPQGTLYGGGAVGGVIRYITNKPDASAFGGSLEAGLSEVASASEMGWETNGVFNIPLLQDRLALRLYGGYQDLPGYITKIGYPDRPGLAPPDQEDQNSSTRFNGRAALRWIMNDSMEATLAYNAQRLDFEGDTGTTPGLGEELTGVGGVAGVVQRQKVDSDLLSLDVEADLGFASLTSNSAYYEERTEARGQDGTRFLLELSEALGFGYELFPQFTMQGSSQIKTSKFTQEFRLVSQGERFIDYLAGAFYSSEDLDQDGPHEETPGLADFMSQLVFGPGVSSSRPDDFEYLELERRETTNWAVFGELTFNLTERWDVTLGGRYFGFDLEGSENIAFPVLEEILDGFGTPGCSPTQPGNDPRLYTCTRGTSSLDADIEDSIFKFNTSYQLANANALLFLTVAEGFRQGGANAVNSTQAGVVDPRFLSFDPDKATSYELGVKSMWFADRLRLNAAVYHIDWEGLQLGTRVGAGFPATLNGNDAEIDGFELDLTAQLASAWQLGFNFNQLDARLAEDTTATPEIDGQKDDRLPGSAETQANLSLRYDHPLASDKYLWVRLGGSYSSDVTAYLNDNQFNQLISPQVLSENRFYDVLPSYTTWNLSAGLEARGWSLMAYADNLFDKAYRVASSTFELGPVDDPLSRQYFYGRPRTIGMRLRYQF